MTISEKPISNALIPYESRADFIQKVMAKGKELCLTKTMEQEWYKCIDLWSEITPIQLINNARRRCNSAKFSFLIKDGKVIYLIDDFYTRKEGDDFRKFTRERSYPRFIYSTPSAKKDGELPTQSLGIIDTYGLITSPPYALKQAFGMLAFFEERLNMQVLVQPRTPLADGIATNMIRHPYSEDSSTLGYHQDCDPSTDNSFNIPVLYQSGKCYPRTFENGAKGKPWLVTLMLYVTEDKFNPKDGLGTLFHFKTSKANIRVPCEHMRMVLFEGDIFHSIEPSARTLGTADTFHRVSFVFKLVFNPKNADQSIKKDFGDLFSK